MYFSTHPELFTPDETARLLEAGQTMLSQADRETTTLNHHLSDAVGRQALGTILEAFFASPLPDLFEAEYGSRPVLNMVNSAIRRHRAEQAKSAVGWHLDMNFVLDRRPYLVAWTPLHAVGQTRSSLDFCWPVDPRAGDQLSTAWMAFGRTNRNRIFEKSDLDTLLAPAGYRTATPELPAGSCVVFDQTVLHRTQVIDGQSSERISIEFRMADIKRPNAIFARHAGLFAVSCSLDDPMYLINAGKLMRLPPDRVRQLQFSRLSERDG